jgi:hypothetical protein
MGSNAGGRFKASLNLLAADGTIHNFELGGYGSLSECLGPLEVEVESAERERGRKFYTNADRSYGGYRAEGLEVEHLIVGFQCLEQR